ncbi:gamma-glutamyltransferase family protein [Aquibium sp. A9E412]|uniref:gamma-glutamyltransferase family protein n=1 Tax=Aquibium sp. A9E412 TaxID=2976767 RepID=UPI0025B25E7F|nr:gamma-glutamyltransferase family protein [Aquibium sp. A9E412]MDN2567466.1 gamma-glutamyltransferase family protein [Aquibium sp. A9E412]
MRDFQEPRRSLVASRNGMAATSHPLATGTALDVMKAGGTAMDAAVAACAVQCVVEPGSTGIGGDCFAMIAPAGSAEPIAYNGSGRAPAAATPQRLAADGVTAIARQSAHAVTVPGAVEAWARLVAEHGRMPLGELLAPAIGLAREGFAVTPRVAFDIGLQRTLLEGDATARATFLPGGAPPAVGSVLRQPLLADTLAAIADGGPDAFYRGAIADEMVDFLRGLGGLHTADDFAAAGGAYVQPVSADYRGYTVHECPPNGQGIIALVILRILERFAPDRAPLDIERLHLIVEATRLAYAARDHFVADPQAADVPTEHLLSDAFIDGLVARIDRTRAMQPPPAADDFEHRDTVYIAVVDKARNAVSFINSIFHPFGAGLMTPKSGVLFHNRGQGFSLTPGHRNAIAPGKRPLHTIIPGMVTREGRTVMPFGVMGGHYQAMGHAWFLSNMIDHGMDVQAAIDAPRLFPLPGGATVEIERPLEAVSGVALAARGFEPQVPAAPIGGAQAVWIDWQNGTLLGGSDPRKDGCALGY